MRSPNRLFFMISIFVIIAAAFIYFERFSNRGRRIVSQPREIVPRGNLAEYENATVLDVRRGDQIRTVELKLWISRKCGLVQLKT